MSTYAGPSTLHSATSRVYLDYDPDTLPPKPDSKDPDNPAQQWTRFVCISDSHGARYDVPSGDVLLHTGDITETGSFGAFEEMADWIYGLPHKVKIVIAGNHDVSLHRGWYEINARRWHGRELVALAPVINLLTGPQARSARMVYLQDQIHRFQVREGGKIWSIYGSPWQPVFANFAFQYKKGPEAKELHSKFPKTDILLTHGPPKGILDELHYNQRLRIDKPTVTVDKRVVGGGCQALADRLPDLQPRLHAFGHIHEARGAEIRQWIPGSPAPLLLNEESESLHTAQTVFVNGANQHGGPRSHGRREWAGHGWQPIIVDLLDGETVPLEETDETSEYTPPSLVDGAAPSKYPYVVPTSFLE